MQLFDSTEVYEFPDGYPGTVATVELLAKIARERAPHPRMRERVLELWRGVPSLDVDGEIARVWEFVLGNVRYQRDTVGVEHITDPVYLDRQVDYGIAAEDCESIALYAATLLAAGGIPSLFEIQGRNKSDPKRFTHCSLRVINPRTGATTSFDPVGAIEIAGFGLGDTLHRTGEPLELYDLDGRKVQEMITLSAALGDVGCSCSSPMGAAFGDAISDFASGGAKGGGGSQFYNTVDQGLNFAESLARNFGPGGVIVGDVVQVGQDVFDAQTGRPVGKALPSKPKSSSGGVGIAIGIAALAAKALF